MPKTIAGVPETISRSQYTDLIRGLGFDPNLTRRITLWSRDLEVEVYDDNGAGRIRDGRTHIVTIRIADPEPGGVDEAAI